MSSPSTQSHFQWSPLPSTSMAFNRQQSLNCPSSTAAISTSNCNQVPVIQRTLSADCSYAHHQRLNKETTDIFFHNLHLSTPPQSTICHQGAGYVRPATLPNPMSIQQQPSISLSKSLSPVTPLTSRFLINNNFYNTHFFSSSTPNTYSNSPYNSPFNEIQSNSSLRLGQSIEEPTSMTKSWYF